MRENLNWNNIQKAEDIKSQTSLNYAVSVLGFIYHL